MLDWAKGLLSFVPLYVALQKGIGAHRLRERCITELDLNPGERVLDVGCGPAYYLGQLPPVRYTGFDTHPRYIDYARRRWGDQAEFHCGVFDASQVDRVAPVDAVLLLGLLHHLDDDACAELLRLTAGVLTPRGRVICVDTCFEPGQGRVSRWMSANDRGEHVRTPARFAALAQPWFGDVTGELVTDATRVPASFWLMRLRAPISATRGDSFGPGAASAGLAGVAASADGDSPGGPAPVDDHV